MANGGSPITGYLVEARPANEDKYIIMGRVTMPTYRAYGLTPGVLYMFRVKAINALGPSEGCELVNPVKVRPLVGECLSQVQNESFFFIVSRRSSENCCCIQYSDSKLNVGFLKDSWQL